MSAELSWTDKNFRYVRTPEHEAAMAVLLEKIRKDRQAVEDPRLQRARALLRPFAAMASVGDQRPKDDAVYVGQDGLRITYGDLRRAKEFLDV